MPDTMGQRVETLGDRLGFGLRFGWSIGTIGPVMLLYVVNYALMFYMTDKLGIAAGLAGLVIFGLRLFDLAFDLLVGILSDRTRSRWGRRRPWMFGGGFATAGACAMLFNIPHALLQPQASSDLPSMLWVMASLILYFAGYSMFNVPYLAMPAEMTESYQERTRLMSLRVAFVAISGFLGISFANWLVAHFGSGLSAYARMSVIMAAIGLASMLWAVFATGDARATTQTTRELPLGRQIGLAFGNSPFVILILAKLLLLLSLSTITTVIFYFVVQVMHRTASTLSLYGLVVNVATLVSLPVWVWLAKSYAKQKLFAIAIAAAIPISLSWMLADAQEPLWAFVLRAFLLGLSAGGSLLMGQSLLPDTIEYDYRRSGLRREGLFASIYSFVEKAAFAFGPLISGTLLSLFGYVSSRAGGPVAVQSAHTLLGIYAGIAILPAGASVLAILLLQFYSLTEDDLRGTTDLAPGGARHHAQAPATGAPPG